MNTWKIGDFPISTQTQFLYGEQAAAVISDWQDGVGQHLSIFVARQGILLLLRPESAWKDALNK